MFCINCNAPISVKSCVRKGTQIACDILCLEMYEEAVTLVAGVPIIPVTEEHPIMD